MASGEAEAVGGPVAEHVVAGAAAEPVAEHAARAAVRWLWMGRGGTCAGCGGGCGTCRRWSPSLARWVNVCWYESALGAIPRRAPI
jgi:hypothetical protein